MSFISCPCPWWPVSSWKPSSILYNEIWLNCQLKHKWSPYTSMGLNELTQGYLSWTWSQTILRSALHFGVWELYNKKPHVTGDSQKQSPEQLTIFFLIFNKKLLPTQESTQRILPLTTQAPNAVCFWKKDQAKKSISFSIISLTPLCGLCLLEIGPETRFVHHSLVKKFPSAQDQSLGVWLVFWLTASGKALYDLAVFGKKLCERLARDKNNHKNIFKSLSEKIGWLCKIDLTI